MPSKDKERITGWLAPEIMVKVKAETEALGISQSAYLNLIIRQHFDAQDTVKNFQNLGELLGKLDDLRQSVEEAKEAAR